MAFWRQQRRAICAIGTSPPEPCRAPRYGALAQELLGLVPEVPFEAGLAETVDWYRATHDHEQVRVDLDRRLLERTTGAFPNP